MRFELYQMKKENQILLIENDKLKKINQANNEYIKYLHRQNYFGSNNIQNLPENMCDNNDGGNSLNNSQINPIDSE